MRMSRVNITMPDDLYQEAKNAGLNISHVAQHAIAAELNRIAKIAALDVYLAELEAAMGPITATEQASAAAWADRVLGPFDNQRSA